MLCALPMDAELSHQMKLYECGIPLSGCREVARGAAEMRLFSRTVRERVCASKRVSRDLYGYILSHISQKREIWGTPYVIHDGFTQGKNGQVPHISGSLRDVGKDVPIFVVFLQRSADMISASFDPGAGVFSRPSANIRVSRRSWS
jgi:hypothetical protein